MKKHLILSAITLALFACSGKTTSPQQPPMPQLETITLSVAKTPLEIKFDGLIEAINQATVSAQTSGRVVELPVDVGDYVKKGDLIVRFTSIEQKARATSAQAKFTEAKIQFTRMQDMLAKQLIAKADFDKAESAFKSAEAALNEANEGAANTAIYAPYAGIVVNRMIKVGEVVAPGTPLMTGLSLEQLRAQVDIPQEHIGRVRQFKQARVLLPSGDTLETNDLRIPPSADLQTHSFKVLVSLPKGNHSLFPGTLVKIAFVTGESEHLLIPASALAQRGEMTGAYVISDQAIDFRLVRLGAMGSDQHLPVLAGLSPGEKIAADPIAAANAYKLTHTLNANKE